jgi:hypothetical protein
MTRTSLVLVLTAGLGGIATAQPGPPPPPDDTVTTDTTVTTPVADPTPPPPPPRQPDPVVAVEPAGEPATARPDGLSFGLGIGYQLPTSLETPNITSMRLRLSTGLTIEPAFAVANTSTSAETGTVETTDKETTFALFALIRLPLISRGKADFEALGRVGFANTKANPEGDYNTTTTNQFGVGWGLAVSYWFTHHWQLSFNVTNDLIDYASQKRQMGPDMDTKGSSTEIGLIFSPAVFMMLHLYN